MLAKLYHFPSSKTSIRGYFLCRWNFVSIPTSPICSYDTLQYQWNNEFPVFCSQLLRKIWTYPFGKASLRLSYLLDGIWQRSLWQKTYLCEPHFPDPFQFYLMFSPSKRKISNATCTNPLWVYMVISCPNIWHDILHFS